MALPHTLLDLYLAHASSAALGCPPHFTLLFPFAPPETIDAELVTRLAGLLHPHGAFDYRLTETRRWPPDTTYLHPEPTEPFVQLHATLAGAFPQFPLYDGAFPFTPHVSLVDDTDEAAHAGAPGVAKGLLPIDERANAVDLIAQGADERWSLIQRFRLRA